MPKKINPEEILRNAMRHLEEHNPECHGINSMGRWYAIDYADYSAYEILKACRILVVRT